MTITIWPPQTAPENEDILTTDIEAMCRELLIANYVDVLDYSTSFTPTAGSGLTLNVAAGVAWIAGKRVKIDAISQLTMTDDATNYVFLDDAGAFHVDTANTPPTNYVNIATVTAAGTVITLVTDMRPTSKRVVDKLYFDYVNQDVLLYRSAANILRTPDALQVDVGVITGKMYPSANGTTAIQITKADGSTALVNVDSTNARLYSYGDLYVSRTVAGAPTTGAIYFGAGTYYIFHNATSFIINSSIFPEADETRDLGSNSYRYSTIHTKALKIHDAQALTIGSLGSLLIPINAAGSTISDAQGGNLNGCLACAWTGTTYKLAVRLNGAWKYVTPAGFGIPNYSVKKNDRDEWIPDNGVDETICPLCEKQMKPKQALGMYADGWWGKDKNDGLHAVAAHLKCLMKLADQEDD